MQGIETSAFSEVVSILFLPLFWLYLDNMSMFALESLHPAHVITNIPEYRRWRMLIIARFTNMLHSNTRVLMATLCAL